MTHFTDFELQRWRESGPGAERQRVVEHLAVCSQCAGKYAAAIRNRPLRAEPAADAAGFKPAGMRVGARPTNRRRWMLSIAAAAVLAVIVALPIGLHRREPVSELHFRGGNVVALAPQGTIDTPNLEFVWSSAISAPRYRVELGDASHVIFREEVTGTHFSAPKTLRDTLRANVEYHWTVTALDASGKPLARSSQRTFVLR